MFSMAAAAGPCGSMSSRSNQIEGEVRRAGEGGGGDVGPRMGCKGADEKQRDLGLIL